MHRAIYKIKCIDAKCLMSAQRARRKYRSMFIYDILSTKTKLDFDMLKYICRCFFKELKVEEAEPCQLKIYV